MKTKFLKVKNQDESSDSDSVYQNFINPKQKQESDPEESEKYIYQMYNEKQDDRIIRGRILDLFKEKP